MHPCSLQQAISWRLACTLVNSVRFLDIENKRDRTRLVSLLRWLTQDEYRCLSNPILLSELHEALTQKIRQNYNPSIFLTCVVILCPQVTIDQIHITSGNYFLLNSESKGLLFELGVTINILKAIKEFQRYKNPPEIKEDKAKKYAEERTESEGSCSDPGEQLSERTEELTSDIGETEESDSDVPILSHVRSLVLEDTYIANPVFLPAMVKNMPNLQHFTVQMNIAPNFLPVLAQHCKGLKSFCLLENTDHTSITPKELIPFLFGVPPELVTDDLLKKFASDEEFRKKFTPQFPELRVLDIEDLFLFCNDSPGEDYVALSLSPTSVHSIYILALLLQPKLESLGKFMYFKYNYLLSLWYIWDTINYPSTDPLVLPMTKVQISEELCTQVTQKDTSKFLNLFRNMKSVELTFVNEKSELVEKVVKILSSTLVKSLSTPCLPLENMSSLSYLRHLRLMRCLHCSFDTVHLILDNCPDLRTLSIHPELFNPPDHRNRRSGEPPEQFLEEDRLAIENMQNLLLAAMANFVRVDEELIMRNREPEQDTPPPQPRVTLPLKRKYKEHTNLVSLRISSICESQQKTTETFLFSLVSRLPLLRVLCLGPWLGSLRTLRPFISCTATALVSVLIQASLTHTPLLTHLEQLCCLPSVNHDGKKICLSLAAVARTLPSLQYLTLPPLEPALLHQTIRYFRHTNIRLRNKCDTDRMFIYWDLEH